MSREKEGIMDMNIDNYNCSYLLRARDFQQLQPILQLGKSS